MKGYTLVETVIVLVIIGLVVGIGVPALLETINGWSFASSFQDNAVSSAIMAMGRMSREIRRLSSDSSIITATTAQLTFNMVDYNGMDDDRITYNRSGNTLMRTVRNSANTVLGSDGLADNVTALTFTYYDDNGTVIAAPVVSPNDTNIRRITVDFSILAGTNTLNFRFQARPQNLRRMNEKFK